MYTYKQVYDGIEKYLEREILHQIHGWKKWVVGTGLELAIQNGNNIFNELKDKEIIRMLNIIHDDKVDVHKLYDCLKKQAEHEEITFDVPMIGTLTLNHDDVDKLYFYITE